MRFGLPWGWKRKPAVDICWQAGHFVNLDDKVVVPFTGDTDDATSLLFFLTMEYGPTYCTYDQRRDQYLVRVGDKTFYGQHHLEALKRAKFALTEGA